MFSSARLLTITIFILLGLAYGAPRIQVQLATAQAANPIVQKTPKLAEKAPCGDELEPTTQAEERAFLSEVSGLWRDGLSPAEAKGKADFPEQEGLIVDGKSIALARVRVRAQIGDGFDGFVAVGPNPVEPSRWIRVGQSDRDGFRLIEAPITANGKPVCLVYRIKTSRLSDNREALLVKGPVLEALGETSRLRSSEESAKESVRIFVR
jgi:hypothetical protein